MVPKPGMILKINTVDGINETCLQQNGYLWKVVRKEDTLGLESIATGFASQFHFRPTTYNIISEPNQEKE